MTRDDFESWNKAQKSSRTRIVTGQYDRIQVPRDVWAPFRLIRGNPPYVTERWEVPTKAQTYRLPFWPVIRHNVPEAYRKSNRIPDKYAYVSCGKGMNPFSPPEMCPVCYHTDWRQMEGYACNIISLSYHHMERLKSEKGTPYTRLHRCQATPENANCPHCANGLSEFQLGYKGHILFNSANWRILSRAGEKLNRHCACGGEIHVTAGACDRCQTILFDTQNSGLSAPEFAKKLHSSCYCENCRTTVDVVPIRKCNRCANPTPLTIFDADLMMRMVPVEGREYTQLEVEIVPASIGSLVPDAYAHLNPYETLDLPAIYAPLPVATMQKALKLGGGGPVPMDPSLSRGDRNAVPSPAGRVVAPPSLPPIYGSGRATAPQVPTLPTGVPAPTVAGVVRSTAPSGQGVPVGPPDLAGAEPTRSMVQALQVPGAPAHAQHQEPSMPPPLRPPPPPMAAMPRMAPIPPAAQPPNPIPQYLNTGTVPPLGTEDEVLDENDVF